MTKSSRLSFPGSWQHNSKIECANPIRQMARLNSVPITRTQSHRPKSSSLARSYFGQAVDGLAPASHIFSRKFCRDFPIHAVVACGGCTGTIEFGAPESAKTLARSITLSESACVVSSSFLVRQRTFLSTNSCMGGFRRCVATANVQKVFRKLAIGGIVGTDTRRVSSRPEEFNWK